MRNLLITLLFGLFCGHLFSQNVLDAKEKQALIDLYNQCNGKEWSSSYLWNLSDSPSSWAGITIKDGHVVEIDLWNAQLKGELPESLGNLKELTKLELSSNAISGNLPKSIFVLPKLKILNLSMQNVRGERTLKSNLPDEINLPECVYFILNKNALKGNLSKKVYMPQVKQIVLDDNNLEGPLKSEWCNFPMLEAYTLSNNNFKGNCEFNFEKTPKLRELFLGGATKGNKGLTGSLPQSIYKLDLLQLEVQNTSIGGNIDERIANWKNIKNLLLFGSKFSGPFPKALEKLENLEILNLAGGNTLEGPLPDLSKLRKLRNLLLSGNNISGQIPSFFSKMTWLRELRMGECNLSGNLPDFLAPKYGEDDDYIEGLCSCRELDLSANKLEGTIPESWSNFKYLVTLNVRKNNLEGNPIPTILAMKNLKILLLGNNNFKGQLQNLFDDAISTLGSCDISNNHFSGMIVSQRYDGEDEPFVRFYPSKVILTGNDFNFKSFENIGQANMEYNNAYIIYNSMNPYGEKVEIQITNDSKDVKLEAYTPEPIDINNDDKLIHNQYQWYFNDNPISGATEDKYILSVNNAQTGVYHCKVKNPIAPELTLSSQPVIVSASLKAAVINNVDDNWSFEDNIIKYEKAMYIELYTMNGQLVVRGNGDSLNCDNIKGGVYIAVSYLNEKCFAKKYIL